MSKNHKLRKFLIKKSSRIINWCKYILIALFIGTAFLYSLLLNSKLVLTVAGHEYNINQTISKSKAITEVQHVIVQCFLIIFFIFFVGIFIFILYFMHKHSNLNKKTFVPNIIEFIMTIGFCVVELFSISYGFIGKTISNASIGLILIIVIDMLSVFIFIIMIWEHIRSLIHDKHYVNGTNINKERNQKMLSIVNRQNRQIYNINKENSNLKTIIKKLNNQ